MSPARINPRQTVTKVTVTTITDGMWGQERGDPFTVWADVDGSRRLVRNGAGEEVVAEQTLRIDPTKTPRAQLRLIRPECAITVDGTERTAITVKPLTNRGRWSYLEVTTT